MDDRESLDLPVLKTTPEDLGHGTRFVIGGHAYIPISFPKASLRSKTAAPLLAGVS